MIAELRDTPPIPKKARNPFVTLYDAQFLLHFNTGEISCM